MDWTSLRVQKSVIVAAVILLPLAAGCSSGKADSPPTAPRSDHAPHSVGANSVGTSIPSTSPTVTVAGYLSQARSICGKYNARLNAIRRPPSGEPTQATLPQYAAYLKAALSVGDRELRDLKALPKPSQLVAAVDALYANMGRARKSAIAMMSAADARNVTAWNDAVFAARSVSSAITTAADAAALSVCANN